MSDLIHKRHNVSALLYHAVCPTKYRRAVITEEVEAVLRRVCLDISNRYEITFLEIGADGDHVHFLVQSVPTYSPKKIVQTIKSITARAVFARVPSVKRQLWGGAFWSSGYYIDTVGRHGSEEAIRLYVAGQAVCGGSGASAGVPPVSRPAARAARPPVGVVLAAEHHATILQIPRSLLRRRFHSLVLTRFPSSFPPASAPVPLVLTLDGRQAPPPRRDPLSRLFFENHNTRTGGDVAVFPAKISKMGLQNAAKISDHCLSGLCDTEDAEVVVADIATPVPATVFQH